MILRAFPSKEVKFLAYTTSKPKILAFNNSFYNTPNIIDSIFFTTSFKYSFFILQLYFFLSFPLCHSQPSKLDLLNKANPYPPHPPPPQKKYQPPIPTYLSNKLTLFHLNPTNPYPSQPPPLKKKKKKNWPGHYLPLPNHKSTTITITKPRSTRRKKKDREAN